MPLRRSPNERLLRSVASYAHVGDVVKLLGAGASPNARDKSGTSALTIAARAPWSIAIDSVRPLLDHGADVNVTDAEGFTPLMACAESGAVETLALLIERGAEVNAAGSEGRTALMFACARLFPEMVLILLQHGARAADVDLRGYEAKDYAGEALFPSPLANEQCGAQVERAARHYLVQLVLNEVGAASNQTSDTQ